MSDKIEVPAQETGVVRLFAVDLPADKIEEFADADRDDWPVIPALGIKDLNPSYVEIFHVKQLEELGLFGYLTEAYNISPEDLKDDRAVLNNIRGHVALISSPAFRGMAQTLRLHHPLRWLGTWAEPRPELDLAPIHSDAAHGTTGDVAPLSKQRLPRWLIWALPLIMISLAVLIAMLTPLGG